MAIRVRILSEPGDIGCCVARFEEFVGVPMPEVYIARGSLYGCFDSNDTMVGGFLLVTEPPYRGVVFLPDRVRETHWLFRTVSGDRMVEVNCVWLEPRLRLSAWDWYVFWWRIVGAIARTGRSCVLVWYNRRNRHLHRFYSRVRKEVIYTGPPGQAAEGRTHAEICVAFSTPENLYFSLIVHLPKLFWLRIRKWWHGVLRRRERPGRQPRA